MNLIVEMEMPKGCYFCPMAEPHPKYWFCRAFDDTTQIDGCAPMDKRRSWCPIKGELPDDHGDLIDRDEVKNEMLKRMPMLCMTASGDNPVVCTRQEMLYQISHAKAVIAAERRARSDG